jgi:hypothetical protein
MKAQSPTKYKNWLGFVVLFTNEFDYFYCNFYHIPNGSKNNSGNNEFRKQPVIFKPATARIPSRGKEN